MEIFGPWTRSLGGLELGSGIYPRIPIVSRNLACSGGCLLLLHQPYQLVLRIQHSHLICQSHPLHCKAKLNFLCCHILASPMHIPPPNTSAVLFSFLVLSSLHNSPGCSGRLKVYQIGATANAALCPGTWNWHT